MTFNVLQLVCLISAVVAVTFSSPVKEKEIRKSRLMFEFDWPKPIQNLKRFPVSESCSHFYHTKKDGSHVIKKCPEGELFDYRSLRCKEKAFAKCWNDLVKRITSKKKKSHFSCPFPWGLYPDTEDCSQFHECLGGKAYTRKCPASTLFDKTERTCVHENKATCADESDSADGYECPFKWGSFTHPKDCSKYYECLLMVPSVRTCKRNMLFDNMKRKCLPMTSVDCGTRLNPYESISTTAESVTSKYSRTEPVGTNIGSSRTKSDRVTTEKTRTKFDGITSESSRSKPEGVSTEHPRTNPEVVSTEKAITKVGRITSEIPQSKPEEVSTEKATTKVEVINSDIPQSKPEEVSTENTITKVGRISSEIPQSKPGEVSTEKARTKVAVITSEIPQSKPEEVSTEKATTKVEVITSEIPQSKPEKVSKEYPEKVITKKSKNKFVMIMPKDIPE